ncbi:hypothetical protein PFISCL1PPCAC_22798 [Pristionchus fissidentatus]|uniref:Nuclear receptor n=1 Tax=Pristionchus fissidentatus TaxID=1538716 RepID=A0AAV5WGW3_9BILA|nr:hypothetical protein PFISCL1PPCAC_22798 [Pristionchus fissidentatus]
MEAVSCINNDANERRCQICEGKASGAHFGVDSCRACGAFFRRTLLNKNQYLCDTGGCGKPRACKKCRFDRCISAGMQPTIILQRQSGSSPIRAVLSSHPEIALLHRLLADYKDFNRERVAFEQHLLDSSSMLVPSALQLVPPDEPHSYTVYTAHYDMITSIYQGIAERSLNYLKSSFEEMYSMKDDEMFTILQNFIFLLHSGEGVYRSARAYTERPLDRFFCSYTTTLVYAEFEKFLEGSEPHMRAPRLIDQCRDLNIRCRDLLIPILDKISISEIEFVAVTVLTLWSISEKSDSQFAKIADKYRKRVFEELHVLYRDEFKLDDYATRLGELMTLATALQISVSSVISELQFINFFDVFEKESFTNKILRKTIVKEEPF